MLNQLEIDIAEYILTHNLLEEYKIDLGQDLRILNQDALIARLQYELQIIFNLDGEVINLIITPEYVNKLLAKESYEQQN